MEYILVKENSTYAIKVWKGAALSDLETESGIQSEFSESESVSIFFPRTSRHNPLKMFAQTLLFLMAANKN